MSYQSYGCFDNDIFLSYLTVTDFAKLFHVIQQRDEVTTGLVRLNDWCKPFIYYWNLYNILILLFFVRYAFTVKVVEK